MPAQRELSTVTGGIDPRVIVDYLIAVSPSVTESLEENARRPA
jgi:hypothetical protein